jgi:hypothetical protein
MSKKKKDTRAAARRVAHRYTKKMAIRRKVTIRIIQK